MQRQSIKKRSSYTEQIAVFDEVLERVEKGFDEFKKELKTDLKEMHEIFVRKDEFKFQIENLNSTVNKIDEKVDTGFKNVEKKLGEGRNISEWLRNNMLTLLAVGAVVLWLIDHSEFVKKLLP